MTCNDSCPFDRKCGRNFTPATLVAAHERVYGTGVQCVDGVAICRVTKAYTHKAWRMLILSWVTRRADDPSTAPTEKFTWSTDPQMTATLLPDGHKHSNTAIGTLQSFVGIKKTGILGLAEVS